MDYKLIEKLQTFLPLGYLYLIILGILRDGVFFYMLGINFLKYSSIMDILISPIAELTSQPIILLTVTLMIIGFFFYYNFLANNSHKKWVRDSMVAKKYLKKKPGSSDVDLKVHIKKQVYFAIAFMISAFFLGGGVGTGLNVKDRITNNKLKIKHRITDDSGNQKDIYLIDSNSAYFFYVEKGSKVITIVPVGSIKKIELINNKMFEDVGFLNRLTL
ncbi:hypothetical protein [Epilithonimonas arachidiradicis]|uniref:Uncharacterized protein n=1 Tax=Epilithonimonas arachidiradicis TaxID=1617282 RepID=A0A420DD22_9FLAO|nr:hypothetical protein [Epilithonimonas arachidiradicis]RKE89693.1 hypothetical protein BXY58_0265 [Epilithonimonas arachidiradicis]GGG44533.1 hypothetical protein GCM10007332_02520 [Epilithonimonas arachidiradicis]